jgi:ribosomal protein L21E
MIQGFLHFLCNSLYKVKPGSIRYPKGMKFKEGDQVRIITREPTLEDKKDHRYYTHMAGLTGSVENVYGDADIAVRIDVNSLGKISKDVHKQATMRMRQKFTDGVSEIQRKELTKEELEFDTHFMLLVHTADLEMA